MPARKLVLLILAILLAFTAWDVVHWYASPESSGTAQTGTVQTLEGAFSVDTDNLEPFQYIVYHLSAPLQGNTRVVLSYVTEDLAAGKINSRVQKGKQKIEFELPLGKYINLNCEIKADVGIQKITLSDQSAEVRIHYPFRATNVLIPSAIMLAVVLLFVYVKPLNNLIKTIDQKIIDPETRHKGITIAYIVFTVAVLLHHIYVILYQKYILTGADDLGVPLLIFAGITVVFGKLWKDKISWILLALLALKYARTALLGEDILAETNYVYIMAIYAFFGCYGVGRAISRKCWKPFLTALCSLWTLAAVVLASIGIVVAITGVPVKNLGSEWFTIASDGRFYFTSHPVTSGVMLSTAMAIAILGFVLTKKKPVKILFVLSSVILFMAGSLTGTRTAYVLSGVELAFLLCLLVYDKLKPGRPDKAFATIGKWAVLTVLFIAATGIIAFAQSYTLDVFKLARTRGSLLISHAYAEQIPEIEHRGFVLSANPDVTFTGRFTIWGNALEVITSSTKNLLLGQSVYHPIEVVDELRATKDLFYVYHCHNTFLQTLLENGIPGFLLYVSFFLTFAFHAVRVLKNRNLPFWQRLIPLPAIGCFVADLADSTCHVTFGYPQMTLLFLFAGFTVALSHQAKKDNSAD